MEFQERKVVRSEHTLRKVPRVQTPVLMCSHPQIMERRMGGNKDQRPVTTANLHICLVSSRFILRGCKQYLPPRVIERSLSNQSAGLEAVPTVSSL